MQFLYWTIASMQPDSVDYTLKNHHCAEIRIYNKGQFEMSSEVERDEVDTAMTNLFPNRRQKKQKLLQPGRCPFNTKIDTQNLTTCGIQISEFSVILSSI
jgi:hypothetical protein